MDDSVSLWDKLCTGCGEVKFITEFTYTRRHGKYQYLNHCKDCRYEARHAVLEQHRQTIVTDIPSYKFCPNCQQEKSIDQFCYNYAAKDKHDNRCKDCKKNKRNLPNPRIPQPPLREHRKANIKRAYGITIEQYEAMFEAQGGVCAVCHEPETAINHLSKEPFALSIDHNHATGQIRGLLCLRCNHALGNLKEDPTRIASLLRYITFYQSRGEDAS